MLCLSLFERKNSPRRLFAQLKRWEKSEADVLECRLDSWSSSSLSFFHKRPFQRIAKPVVASCLPRSAGGDFSGSLSERYELLRAALFPGGARWVDWEISEDLSQIPDFPPPQKRHLILSYHHPEHPPIHLERILKAMIRHNPFAVKIACAARSFQETLWVLRLWKKFRKELHQKKIHTIFLSMGEYGLYTRLLYRRWNQLWTYVAPDPHRKTAPGQITLSEAKTLYRIHRVTPQTKVFGLIGHPVSHSISPPFFNTVFRQKKIKAIYVPFLVDSLSDIRTLIRTLQPQGLSVTMPFKEAVLCLPSRLSSEAREVHAVNTLVLSKGGSTLVGYNTDYLALAHLLRTQKAEKSRRVLVIGAGGAARVSVAVLRTLGFEVYVANRNSARALELCRCFHISYWDKRGPKIFFDGVVNATPLGMAPGHDRRLSLPSNACLGPGSFVVDWVYSPLRTPLVRLARRRHASLLDGLTLFHAQAFYQLQLFEGSGDKV